MKLIDWYIFRKFIGTFFLFFVLLMMIAVVIDISEKLDDFTVNGASLEEIVNDYYINFVTYYGNLFSALILFLSTIYFTSKMANNTEIVPILTGGRSFARYTLPYFMGAFIVFLISAAVNHFIIPMTNVDRLDFEMKYTKVRDERKTQNTFRQVKPGHFVYFRSFTPEKNTGYNFAYYVIEDQKMKSSLNVDYMRFDTVTGNWKLQGWRTRIIHPDGSETIKQAQGQVKDTAFVFDGDDIVPKLFATEMMTTPQLLDFIDKERMRGSEMMNRHLIELNKRSSYPFSSFILVLIAVSISSRKRRGGLGVNIAIGLVLVMIYIFFMQVSTSLSEAGSVSPALAVWTPNIVFGLLGLYTFRIAPK